MKRLSLPVPDPARTAHQDIDWPQQHHLSVLGALDANNVTLDFSWPVQPTDHGFIEAFNSEFQAECLNAHWFLTLADAREKMKHWRRYRNEVRPHSAIAYNVPIACQCGWDASVIRPTVVPAFQIAVEINTAWRVRKLPVAQFVAPKSSFEKCHARQKSLYLSENSGCKGNHPRM